MTQTRLLALRVTGACADHRARLRLTVLALAVGGNVSEGILKALALSRLRCRVVGADVGPHKLGLYTVDRAYLAPYAREPHFADWLIELCRKERVDAVLTGAEDRKSVV